MGYLYLFGYIILIGVGTFIQKLAVKQLSPYQLQFLISVSMFLIATPALFLSQKSFSLTPQAVPIGSLVGILFSVGSLLFTLALSKLEPGLTSALSVTYVIIVVLLSTIFLKEKLSVIKIVGIILTLSGVGLLYFHDS